MTVTAGRVDSLGLSDKRLTTLPSEIGNLTNLTELWLSDNQLTALPPKIGNVTKLITLDLSENQLTSIPVELCSLNQLKYLNFSSNKICEESLTIPVVTWLDNHDSDWRLIQFNSTFTYAAHQRISVNKAITVTADMTDAMTCNGLSFTLVVKKGSNFSVNGTTVTPDLDFTGTLAVPVRIVTTRDVGYAIISDSSEWVMMQIKVDDPNATNSAPILTNALMQKIGKGTFAILPSMTDAKDEDNDPLTVLTFPGTGYTNSGNTITPNAGYSGSLIVPIAVTDGVASSSVINMIVTVDPNVAITSTTFAKTIPLTATISGRTLTLSQPVGAGSSVNLYDLTGRVVHRSAVVGSSAAIPSLARGIYVAEILAGGKSVVQKVKID